MKLCVIGTGYVGLVAGAAFADYGNNVICVDIDPEKIKMLKEGKIPIYEPGLDKIVERNAKKGFITFTTDIVTAVKGVKVIFMAVGTPQGDDGNADLKYLEQATKTVASSINSDVIVVHKSTVPVGTASKMQEIYDKESKYKVSVVSNPEFLKEGDAINDFMKPERIIIGTNDETTRATMHELYSPFVRTRDRIIDMDPISAELTKYASNAFLATRISFMNDLSRLCDLVGADIELIRRGMGSDSRIGPKFLYPGIGYGGSCFPKDISAILYLSRSLDSRLSIVEETSNVNDTQKGLVVDKMLRHFKSLNGMTVAVLGLAFKPNTDDTREAPAKVIIRRLKENGANVRAYDPVAQENFKNEFPEDANLKYCNGLYETVTGADAAILCTEWKEFQQPDFERISKLMKGRALFDGRNVWSRKETARCGFRLEGIGRPVTGEK
ncbi:UDP-glucose/GDP-mannose dehydrogenase family protein [Myxococcota bacterium]|nr:UDP-glucose/GDP-mannose dehydrogenase family protein [Myxococcota bacterium]MBU1381162.1 UDP-glucose/GDP-mannose dehydrogenase family protein [Myxococcota bacterium]MBU1496734.1 UDP-glucose/GDP-mannose dehydrogenase family protein [Myxococcota bacterium]